MEVGHPEYMSSRVGIGGAEVTMPVIAEMVCQSCGTHVEVPTVAHQEFATPCACGGIRQVVRIVRRSQHSGSASAAALERNVQERAGDETLTP
jgi:hypothetical protein